MKYASLVIIVVLIGISVLAAGSLTLFLGGVPQSHQAILDKTVVTAKIASDMPYEPLEANLIESGSQEITALGILEIAKKASWVGRDLPYSLWKFTYQGEPLVFMRVWGPSEDSECLVEFSKMTMTDVWIDVADVTHHFPLADLELGGSEAYWWLYVGVD